MEKLWQKIRHNQTLVISGILALAVAYSAYGCHPTVRSILRPDTRLDRTAFLAEVESLAAQVESRFKNLEQQEKLKNALFAIAVQYVKGETVNPIAVGVTLLAILGGGAVVDNRRKDLIIKTLKNNAG